MVSHRKSRSFCINLYHVTMVLLMHFYYGASNKLAFVLYSDKSGFTLLLELVIDLRSVVKLYNPPKVARCNIKSHTVFDRALLNGLDS